MKKILIFSDIHIAPHKQSLQRLDDCIQALEWVFRTARNRGIKDVVFLGDLFHDRQKIQVIAYHKTFNVFWDYRDLKIRLLLGNHDLWFYEKWDVSSVAPLMALPNVEVISSPCALEVCGLKVDFLPFTHDPVKAFKGFENKSRVLFSHVAVNDAVLNKLHGTRSEVSIESEKDVIPVGRELFDGWERVFLGHYHCAQKLGRIEYVGSPLELSFNEAEQEKHIIIMDVDTLECEYVVNDFSPKHLIVKNENIDFKSLDNNFVKIEVNDINSFEMIEMRKNIIDSCNVQSLEFKEIKKEIKNNATKEKFNVTKGDILERYVSASNNDLDRNKLIEIGREICNEN